MSAECRLSAVVTVFPAIHGDHHKSMSGILAKPGFFLIFQ